MEDADCYDRVVIGAGIIGACAAYQLMKAGHRRVLLLDQFPVCHTRGSSHGQTRVIHASYGDRVQPQMARRSLVLWRDIQRQTDETLHVDCPMVVIGSTAVKASEFRKRIESLEDKTILNSQQISDILQIADFPEEAIACVENTAGLLFANRCLNNVIRLFKASGGHLRDSWPVTGIIPRGKRVTIHGPHGSIIANGLVVCTGAWAAKLLAPLLGDEVKRLLSPVKVPVMYWRLKDLKEGHSTPNVAAVDHSSGLDFYWLPCLEYPGMIKLCPHAGVPCDPDGRDEVSVANLIEDSSQYVRSRLPGLEPTPAIIETCMYTNTPDRRCIIDVLPRHSNIVIAVGMSGNGFKMGPVFGEAIQGLIDGKKSEFDLSSFSLRRFQDLRKARL